MSKRVAIPGSERAAPPGAVAAGSVPAERISVTVLVRPRTPPQDTARAIAAVAPSARRYLTREEFAERHGADPQDVLAVERFAVDAGLLVLEADCARRSVVLEGAPNELAAAFGTSLALYRSGDTVFRGRVGTLSIPVSLDGIVTGVFGLDERPQARAQVRIRPALANATSYTPLQVAQAYAFPSGLDGTGQTIALIELGGGFAQSDLEAYFASIGLAPPNVTSVSVDGGQNGGGKDPNGADGEVLLDIEVAGAVAPGAKIVVYFAPNTDQGFIDAVSTAIHDTSNDPTIVSISWGGAESTWTAQAISALDSAIADGATLGVTVLCAAGDSGSSDGVADGKAHVDFPASSPHALGCGGTRLELSGTAIASETVWSDGSSGGATGGGISAVFPVPAWQQSAKIPPSANAGASPGRGVPDVAGDADPQTGYDIRVDGQTTVVGGTSAVAPLWAGLVARINQHRAQPLGFVNTQLYANPSAFHDITSGNNGAYAAGPGWDACTGLGTPNGAALLTALS